MRGGTPANDLPGQNPLAPAVRWAAVEDDTMVHVGLTSAPELAGFELVMLTTSVEELLNLRPQVDVVVLDLLLRDDLPTLQGAAAIRALTAHGYRVLIYTSEHRPAVLVACLGKGALGVVRKRSSARELADAIRVVAAGRFHITTSVAGLEELFYRVRKAELPELTPRMLQILRARARGEQDATIADRLGITVRTVEHHKNELTARVALLLTRLGHDGSLRRSAADIEHMLGLGPGDLLDPFD